MKRLLLLAVFLSADIALGANINGPLNGACLQNITSDPSSPCEGRLFWDSDDNLFRFYTGAAWRTVADTTATIANPMTTRGDLIRATTGGAVERVAAVTDNRVVRGDGTDVVSGQIDDPDFFTTGAIATSSLPGLIPTYEANTACSTSLTGNNGSPGGDGTTICRYYKFGPMIHLELTVTGFDTDGSDTVTITIPFAPQTSQVLPFTAIAAGAYTVGRAFLVAASTSVALSISYSSSPFTGTSDDNTLQININYEVD